jgi:hypothetical protein
MKVTSQKKIVADYLRGTGRSLTADQARTGFGIQCLRARISELESDGLVVRRTKTRFGMEYQISKRDIAGERTNMFGTPLSFE